MSCLVFLLGNSQVTATEPQGKEIIFEKGECISQKTPKLSKNYMLKASNTNTIFKDAVIFLSNFEIKVKLISWSMIISNGFQWLIDNCREYL